MASALFLWPHVELSGQDRPGETDEGDQLILNEIYDSFLEPWEHQKQLLASLSYITDEERALIANSKTPRELLLKLQGKNTPLIEVVTFVNSMLLDSGNLKIRNISAYSKTERSKTLVRVGLGGAEFVWQQDILNNNSESGVCAVYTNMNYILNIGNLRPRAGFGMVMGPVRNTGVSVSGIQSAWRLHPSVRNIRVKNNQGLIHGLSLSNTGENPEWMVFSGKLLDNGRPGAGGAATIGKGENRVGLIFFSKDITQKFIAGSALFLHRSEPLKMSMETGSDGRGGRGTAVHAVVEHENIQYNIYVRRFVGLVANPMSRPPSKWSGKRIDETGIFGAVVYIENGKRIELFYDQAWKPSRFYKILYRKVGSSLDFRTQRIHYSLFIRDEFIKDDQQNLFLDQPRWSDERKIIIRGSAATRKSHPVHIRLRTLIEEKERENKKNVMCFGVVSATKTIAGIRSTLSLARSMSTGAPFTVYIYGLNLYGEAPGIPVKGRSSAIGLKLQYKDKGSSVLAFKIIATKDKRGGIGAQVSILYSCSY